MTTNSTSDPISNAVHAANYAINGLEDLTNDDAAWILQCAFLVLTMQTGFAMLDGGCVSSKNMANIMIKNVCDVSVGGFAYWLFGYGLTHGHPGNSFIAYGDFAFHETNHSYIGTRFSHYFFQFSFASTATTIVSGAVAERMKFFAYVIFSFANIFVYAIPARWIWADIGFLKKMGFYDFAGVCAVHLNGGTSAIVAATMLGPRYGRFERPDTFAMSSPAQALTGMFMLTWAWLGFNSGATYGIMHLKWKVSAVVATCTLNGAIGGGIAGLALSMAHHKRKILVDDVIDSLLGGLVSVTGCCAVVTTYEALIVGAIGGSFAVYTSKLTNKLRIDDPVGAISVHFAAAAWGTCAIGIFGQDNVVGHLEWDIGILHGGSGRLLGIHVFGAFVVILWSAVVSFLILYTLDKVMGIRMDPTSEIVGADFTDHGIKHSTSDRLERALMYLGEEKVNKIIDQIMRDIDPLFGAATLNSVKVTSIDDKVQYLKHTGVELRRRPKTPKTGFTQVDPETQHGNGHLAFHPKHIHVIGLAPSPSPSEGDDPNRIHPDSSGGPMSTELDGGKERRPSRIRQFFAAVVAPSENIALARQRKWSLTQSIASKGTPNEMN